MSNLIDREELRKAMYHEAFEKDSDEQRWDSGCWIRYKMFERVLASIPSVQPEQKAIEALEQIEAIEGIIDVPNTIIQEDVLKYKMIVDVVKGDWCEEKEPRGKEDEEK